MMQKQQRQEIKIFKEKVKRNAVQLNKHQKIKCKGQQVLLTGSPLFATFRFQGNILNNYISHEFSVTVQVQ